MTWSIAAQNHLAARAGYAPRWLLWVAATERLTGDPAPVGIWNGDDHLTFTIAGQPRLYLGAQGRFEVADIVFATGTQVRTLDVQLSGISPEAEQLVRGYVVRFARAELHLALLDPQSFALIDVQRVWKGFVNRAPIMTPPIGGEATIALELASAMRSLTCSLALKKSDQSQRLRAGDRFRQYGSVAAAVTTEWNKP